MLRPACLTGEEYESITDGLNQFGGATASQPGEYGPNFGLYVENGTEFSLHPTQHDIDEYHSAGKSCSDSFPLHDGSLLTLVGYTPGRWSETDSTQYYNSPEQETSSAPATPTLRVTAQGSRTIEQEPYTPQLGKYDNNMHVLCNSSVTDPEDFPNALLVLKRSSNTNKSPNYNQTEPNFEPRLPGVSYPQPRSSIGKAIPICVPCCRQFAGLYELKRHRETVHGEWTKRWVCIYGDYWCPRKDKVHDHYKNKHVPKGRTCQGERAILETRSTAA